MNGIILVATRQQHCLADEKPSIQYIKRHGKVHKRKSSTILRSNSYDVLFLVETEPKNVWRVPAQRKIIEENNPVFKAMFSQDIWAPRGQISVSDVDGRGFENLIKFLHFEPVDLRSVHTAVATLHASQQYLCSELTECCVDYLGKNLTISNVLQVLQHVLLYCPSGCRPNYEAPDPTPALTSDPTAPPLESFTPVIQDGSSVCSLLVKKCLDFIDKNASILLNSEEFEDLDRAAVELITKRDTLILFDELEVFDALKSWAICECKRQNRESTPADQRNVLGDLLWTIRYLAMSSEQFMKGPVTSQLLLPEEQEQLINLFLNSSSHYSDLIEVDASYLRRKRNYQDGVKQGKKGRFRKNSDKNKDGSFECEKRTTDSPYVEKFFVFLALIFE
ncbi:BTB/POZ domain-containing protein 6-like isoform X3 [Artemia franciscana]|uniref:BTB/POZ domain-containing protein 6-like isoform X2 n=1 Tax=Artemia franciscana TaxID=6661 RepID=UPI0032DBA429